MYLKYRQIKSTLWLIILFSADSIWALPSDRQQPVSVEANRAEMDDQKGISIYRGNVILMQGSMILKCNLLTTYHANENRALIKAVAEGNPASFRQRPATDKEEITATAPRIEYIADKQLIYLLDNAEVTQGRNIFKSKRIEYNIQDNQIHAEGGANQNERVKIILFPQEKAKSNPINTTSKNTSSSQSGEKP